MPVPWVLNPMPTLLIPVRILSLAAVMRMSEVSLVLATIPLTPVLVMMLLLIAATRFELSCVLRSMASEPMELRALSLAVRLIAASPVAAT